MSFLEIEHLEKFFGPNQVVKDFNLGIEKGEFISFLGPSGCGKTTTLRMVAGFETPTSGRISIDGKDVVNQRPNQRNIGMVFQSYALFPNLTVAQNVAFGLRVARVAKAQTRDRVAEMLSIVGLSDFGARFPFQLSGGQQQRVALARALAVQPQVLLLDEPLSALDAKIRVSLRTEIREIQKKLGITTIYVTHDQEEALSMSDRIVVMHRGVADQVGTPFEIYNQPRTRFVASFVGTLNQMDATILDPDQGTVQIASGGLNLGRSLAGKPGAEVALAVRPEAVYLGRQEGRDIVLPGRIVDVDFLGSVMRIKVDTGSGLMSLDMFNRPSAPPPKAGEQVELSVAARDIILLVD